MSNYREDLMLGVGTSTETGLFHGILHRNCPTPSGCERWLLKLSTTEGFVSPREAARTINLVAGEYNAKPLKEEDYEHIVIPEMPELPPKAELTLVTPRDGTAPYVTYLKNGKTQNDLHVTHLKMLIGQKKAESDSSSGDDHELSARYDHYVLIA